MKTLKLFAIFALSMAMFIGPGIIPAWAAKGGNPGKPGGSGDDGGEYDGAACIDSVSEFPTFAFIRLIESNKRGGGSTEFYLSNAAGDCELMILRTGVTSNSQEITYRQIGNKGIIVWKQGYDENAGRKDPDRNFDRLKRVEFELDGQEIVTPLPLVSQEVAAVNQDAISFRYIDLSRDGNTILVSHGDSYSTPDVTYNSIREIDISNCSSNCPMSEPLFAHEEFAFVGLTYGALEDRIYFASAFRSSSTDPRAGLAYISFIERTQDGWSEPRELSAEDNGEYPFEGIRYFRQPDAAIVDLGNGPTEIVAFSIDTEPGRVTQVIDTGNCQVSGIGDCVSAEESEVLFTFDDARNVNFDDEFNATTLIMTTEDGLIEELDLQTLARNPLTVGLQADYAD